MKKIATTLIATIIIICSSCEEGKVVFNNKSDSSVYQITEILELHDSYEPLEWSEVVELSNGNFTVRHKYNLNGECQNNIFTLSPEGNYINSKPY